MRPTPPKPPRAPRADRRREARGPGRSFGRRVLFYIEIVVIGTITIVGVVMSLLSAARAVRSALGW